MWGGVSTSDINNLIGVNPLAREFMDFIHQDTTLAVHGPKNQIFSYNNVLDKTSLPRHREYKKEKYFCADFIPVKSDYWDPFKVKMYVYYEKHTDLVYILARWKDGKSKTFKLKTKEDFPKFTQFVIDGMDFWKQKQRSQKAGEVVKKFSNMEFRSRLDDVISPEKQKLMTISDGYDGSKTIINSKSAHRYNMSIEMVENKDEYKLVAKVKTLVDGQALLKILGDFFENLPLTAKEKKILKELDSDKKV